MGKFEIGLERRRAEKQRRRAEGERAANKNTDFRQRDRTSKSGRPVVQPTDPDPEINEYLRKLVVDQGTLLGTAKLWDPDYTKDRDDKPPKLSKRYLDRWRKSAETFAIFGRYVHVTDPDILRRAPKGGSWRWVTWNVDEKKKMLC